jgi:hypothetical protein
MPSVMMNIGIEVEVFYEETNGEINAIHAAVLTDGLPAPLEAYAKVQAIEMFEKNPRACIDAEKRALSR